jgi:hypothetical protein
VVEEYDNAPFFGEDFGYSVAKADGFGAFIEAAMVFDDCACGTCVWSGVTCC